jgi:hypothetical protein
MGQFAKGSVSVTYGSKRGEDGQWLAVVTKHTREGVIDLSPSRAFKWRSTAWRNAKALARANINLFIPESTEESRRESAENVINWAFSQQNEFLKTWQAEFAPYLRIAA